VNEIFFSPLLSFLISYGRCLLPPSLLEPDVEKGCPPPLPSFSSYLFRLSSELRFRCLPLFPLSPAGGPPSFLACPVNPFFHSQRGGDLIFGGPFPRKTNPPPPLLGRGEGYFFFLSQFQSCSRINAFFFWGQHGTSDRLFLFPFFVADVSLSLPLSFRVYEKIFFFFFFLGFLALLEVSLRPFVFFFLFFCGLFFFLNSSLLICGCWD